MFRSAIWQAVLDAERQGAGAVVVEEVAPDTENQWKASREQEPRSALLRRAAAAGERLGALLPAPSSPPPSPPVVALLLPRSAEYVAAVLAVLASGAAFLPLELSASVGQQGAVVATAAAAAMAVARAAGARVLVVPDESLAASAASAVAEAPLRVASVLELFPPAAGTEQGRQGDRAEEGPAPEPPPAPPPPQAPPLPHYCLMPTSGSTASAKMVRLTEEGLLRRCRWALQGGGESGDDDNHHENHPPSPPLLRRGDAVALTTSPAFVDHLAQQMFAPLLFVGEHDGPSVAEPPLRLVVVREEEEENSDDANRPPLLARPRALVAALDHARATHFVTVPTVLAAIVATGLPLPASLRCLISSGEPLAVALAEALLLQPQRPQPSSSSSSSPPSSALRLLNLYGSTETSGDCAWLDVGWWLRRRRRSGAAGAAAAPPATAAAVVPAGLPLDTGVALRLRPPEDGAAGEVLVGGWCVAAGYVNGAREDGAFWTEDDDDDDGKAPQRRWFATGDRGRWSVCEGEGDGPLRLLHVEGRILDSNSGTSSFAKVAGGARVDLAAIEAALTLGASSSSSGSHGPVAVRAWPLLPAGSGSFLAAYVEEPANDSNNTPRLLAPNDPLRRTLERATDAAGLPARCRPSVYLALAALPRSAGAGKLLRGALPQPPPPPKPPKQPVSSEASVLAAFQAALEVVVGEQDPSLSPPLEPAEDALQRAGAGRGGGAASRVAVAAAAALGVPVALVFAFPSARALARALRNREEQQQALSCGQKRRGREDEEDDEEAADRRPWPQADELWSVPLDMCVDASPAVAVAGSSSNGAPVAVAAASHGGELACWPLPPASSSDPNVAPLRLGLPGPLDAGLAAVGSSLLAVVCRGRAGEGSTLHLAPCCTNAGAPMPVPLPLGAHVSSPPAVLRRLQDDAAQNHHHHHLFLATHAPNPRLLAVRVSVSSSSSAPDWGLLASCPLPAPSAATPLVLAEGAAAADATARLVVATLAGGLAAFDFFGGGEGEPSTLRQAWLSKGAASPIFGSPVALPPLVVAAHVDGRVRAVRASDGAEAWEAAAALGGADALLFARLAVVSNSKNAVVVAATEDGVLYGLEGASGRRLWRLRLRGGRGGDGGGDAGLCSPAVVAASRGLVVAAHDGRLFGLRFAGGEKGGVLSVPPVVISEQRVPAATYGAPVLVGVGGVAGAGAVGEEGAAATEASSSRAAAVVALGCRDDRVRAVRVRL